MRNITEGQPDFKTFEREIFKIMCRIACELMRIYLELRDKALMAMRDTKEYRYIEKRTTTVKTLMGEVTFKRVYYKRRSGGYVFLLDEAMKIGCGCGLVSENLAEEIVIGCTDKSFRKAARSISTLTGQTISAMGVWGIFQKYGMAIARQVERLKELDESGSVGHLGNKPGRVLFNEYDDVWISRQKEVRRKRGESAAGETGEPEKKLGKRPMHVGIAYTGWEESKDGRYSTVDKIAYASFGEVSGFVSTFESLLCQHYDMDGVERRLTNGDGESWIRAAAEDADSDLQLNPYHRGKSVIKAVSNKADRNLLFDAIREKDVDKALDIIAKLIAMEEDAKSKKKLIDLYRYFSNNRDIFLTWQERGIVLPTPPQGVTYRGMGVQESNNCSLITQRMKHRRGSWSVKGGDNMAMMLCFQNTIGLDVFLSTLPEPEPPEAWVEPLSAAKAPQYDGKGYGADWLYAKMPFDQAFRTHGREVIRNMLRMRPVSRLSLI
jgi:hypothetical protein